ncbi:MAG TPA: DUF4383 domain-containing protein [Catenuloplanes sp.]
MAHYPVDHHLRPLYRLLAGLIGLGYVVFGLLAAAVSWGAPVFDRGGIWMLGLRTNLAWSVLAIVIGAVVLAGVVIGRNVYHRVSTVAGWALVVLGIFQMAILQTSVNVLNFSMVNVLTCLVTGLLLITAGLYGRVGEPGRGHTDPGVGHERDARVPA